MSDHHSTNKPRFSNRIIHENGEVRRVPFANALAARAFFESLRNAAHPAEPNPVRFAELAMRIGDGPWTVLDSFGDEGGAR